MLFDKIIKTETKVLEIVTNELTNKENLILTYLNQHCFNIYNSNKEYKYLLDNTIKVFTDGIGIHTASKFLGYREAKKFNATDLYRKMFQHFSNEKAKLFLIGGDFKDEFVFKTAKQKNIDICGYQNGFYDNEEINKIIEKIDNASADIIVIGMGVPVQEQLAVIISNKIQNKVILCVGGFLEFYFGTKKRAPELLKRFGLEWLYRLWLEPKRLWKRYLIGIPLFIFRILKLKISK